jgi:hypothetical protein
MATHLGPAKLPWSGRHIGPMRVWAGCEESRRSLLQKIIKLI